MTVRRNVLPFVTQSEIESSAPVVIDHLRSNGVLAYPTETVYGLGGLCTTQAVGALTHLKGREEGKTFLVIVAGIEMIDALGLLWTTAARALAEKFWPGPLTLVLRSGGNSNLDSVVAPNGGVAVRWTSHPAMAYILQELGAPITSTSANPTGTAPATTALQVQERFAADLDRGTLVLLDGGALPLSLPSTVVDCSMDAPKIVRQGAISRAELHPIVAT